jgi:5-oxoprolinase (ATP-hydrolysing)
MADANWQFWVDRGGTFTDVVAQRPDGQLVVHKLLSENPTQYADAAIAGIQAMLDQAGVTDVQGVVKLGTTVTTNALLERQGARTVLVTTAGFGDALRIGYQHRPEIFARQIVLPEMLYERVIEVPERLDAQGNVRQAMTDAAIAQLKTALVAAKADGMISCAIVLLHGYRYPDHESQVAAIAAAVGFAQISRSHEISARIKFISRGDTTVADAYLSPILRDYVSQVQQALAATDRLAQSQLELMQSNGGLIEAQAFQGKDSLLSGPAGGIVGAVKTAQAAGLERIISFDMGGTSTDVAHFAGEYERSLETQVVGVRVCVPMMAIHTVAAGGGSLLQFDGDRLRVGPASAGSNPGPACYRNGGGLTVTDCQVLLGRIQPDFFPAVFGPQGDQPIDAAIVRQKFHALAAEIPGNPSPETLATGAIAIAVKKMATAIQQISIQRGHDITAYTLSCFGGAGGQHACQIATALGMQEIFIHPLAGVLSAYGIGLADRRRVEQRSLDLPLSAAIIPSIDAAIAQLTDLAHQSFNLVDRDRLKTQARLHLRYGGTDSTLLVNYESNIAAIIQTFEQRYRQRYGFNPNSQTLIVAMVEVESVLPSAVRVMSPNQARRSGDLAPIGEREVYLGDSWQFVPIYREADLQPGDRIDAPALMIATTGTNVLEPGWRAIVDESGNLRFQQVEEAKLNSNIVVDANIAQAESPDPIKLEIFNHLFMAIAEQMGLTLQQTSASVNIKERLDFSCAIFDEAGELIANAPHIPVHLGSMGDSITSLIVAKSGQFFPGDVYVMNNPYNGGTHLPDVTVITPVFIDADQKKPRFYVASRGHHADLGGITPGSMPSHSQSIHEEGILLDHVQLVDRGIFQTTMIAQCLTSGPYPVRNLSQNLADLQAQIAANQKGAQELQAMVNQYGLNTVQNYMRFVQDNAEAAVKRAILNLSPGEFIYPMDDGSQIQVRLSVDPATRSATIDFTGTSAQSPTNFNAPRSVVKAAVVYVFRTLIDDDIPLNAGCLKPLKLIIPAGSMLNPLYPAAVVAGNVEVSQAVTNALYGAMGILAAGQGTMNNLTFGNADYQYYETIAGGSGAGPDFSGTDAVQTHMTNSRLTDPEILEARFPVLVQAFQIRENSGGIGKFCGGNGVIRTIKFETAMTVNILSGHRVIPPFGLAGGGDGTIGANMIQRANGTIEHLPGSAAIEVSPGDCISILTPGGGGYGLIE